MGVLKFQSWLRREFKIFYSKVLAELADGLKVDRLFIDFNAMIHNAINEAYRTDDEHEKEKMFKSPESYWLGDDGVAGLIMAEIIAILDIVRPESLLYIAADGPVMKAKLIQQRQRSFKSKPGGEPFNRNQVKPGTEFMQTICAEIRSRLAKHAENVISARDSFPRVVEFSDATAFGEGEHKIMIAMKRKTDRVGRGRRPIDVIYSPDSDMHFLTYLHASPEDNVIIMRKVHEVKEDGEEFEYFYATKIRDALMRKGFHSIRDFVLICCLGGNDFVPALPFLKFGDGDVFGALSKAYLDTFGKDRRHEVMYNASKVNWGMFQRYLESLEPISEQFLSEVGKAQVSQSYKYYDPLNGDDRRSKVLMWAMGDESSEYKPEFNQAFFNQKYKQFIFGTFHESHEIREDFNFDSTIEQVRNYLEGLVWVMSYYDNQDAGVNHDWAYQFHYPPDVADLRKYVMIYKDNPTWEFNPLNTTIQVRNTPLEHLMAILRKEDLHLVPAIVRTLFLQEMPHLFPESVQIDRTLVPIGEEGRDIVLIDYPNMAEIRRVFEAIREDPNVQARNVKRGLFKVWPKTKGKKKE